MGKILRIAASITVALLPFLLIAQSVENNEIVFRETFGSEFSVRRNGGTPTDVTFSNGICSFSGAVISDIVYKQDVIKSNGFTFRIKIDFGTPGSSKVYLFQGISWYGANFWTLRTEGGTNNFFLVIKTGGNTKVDETDWKELLTDEKIITITYDGTDITIYVDSDLKLTKTVAIGNIIGYDFSLGGRRSGDAAKFDSDLIEIYNYALSSDEVANLHSNKRFRELTGQSEILNISAQSGSIINRQGNALTNTAVTVFKDGDARVMLFDGSTSKIDAGSPKIMTGDRSLVVWAKPYSIGEIAGRIIDDSKFQLYVTSTLVWRLRSNASGSANTAPTSVELNKWQMIGLSRAANGDANIYLNGVLSSSVNDNSGIPVAGVNIIIGNDNNQTRSFYGLMNDIRIYEGILSAEKINQLYTNEKHKYLK